MVANPNTIFVSRLKIKLYLEKESYFYTETFLNVIHFEYIRIT